MSRNGPGFYGKVHTHGDFIARDLPREFIDPWDAWLQSSLQASRHSLGSEWLDRYLVCPVWRFALAGGICGMHAWVGLLMPSVDRVGRYFPLTLAVAVPPESYAACFTAAQPWFDEARGVLLSALEDDFDLDRFHERVRALGQPQEPHPGCPEAGRPWLLRLDPGTSLSETLPRMTPGLLAACYRPASLWWTEDAREIPARFMAWCGLPAPEGFAALLSDRWTGPSWKDCAGGTATARTATPPSRT